VVLARPDGSDLHSPTGGVPGSDQTNPDWSPDGSMLVFGVAVGERENLWVVNADGTDPRVLVDCDTDCLFLDDAAWAPDGSSVMFSRMREVDGAPVGTLERIDLASGAVDVIVTAASGSFYAGQRWSPDQTEVVLELVKLVTPSLEADVEDVSLVIIDLSAPTPGGRVLTEPGTFPETAAWAPDGSRIIFGALEAPDAMDKDLFEIRPDGTGLRRLTSLVAQGGSATHPEVTADGSAVVFAGRIPGEAVTVLGLVDLDSGEVTSATGAEFLQGVHPRLRPMP
jgi:Tol biopolymer transport system component